MTKRLIISTLFLVTASLVWTVASDAAVPQKINYQGYLTDSGGAPLTGTYSMVFSLCDAASGGNCPWTETQSVSVNKGVFSVVLGSVTPITLAFDVQYYLDIQVGGEQMTTRQPLTSVAYAFRANAAAASSDTTAPVPGNSGTITATNSGLDIVLSWTAATDNVTPQGTLEYTVFYSTSSNINTVANAEANGTVVGLPWSSNLTSKTVTGLTVGTTYYFNVAVKDSGLNKAVYTTVSKVPSVPTTDIILYAQGASYGGNLGGRSGADAACSASANKPAGYSNYAAFLSVNASDTIAGRQAFSGLNTSRSIRSNSGTLIANNWADLLDGTIYSTLAAAGLGLSTGYWWSGSNADGTLGLTCSGWTSSVNPASGIDPSGDWGMDNSTSSLWINPGAVDRTYCADPSDLLCIAW